MAATAPMTQVRADTNCHNTVHMCTVYLLLLSCPATGRQRDFQCSQTHYLAFSYYAGWNNRLITAASAAMTAELNGYTLIWNDPEFRELFDFDKLTRDYCIVSRVDEHKVVAFKTGVALFYQFAKHKGEAHYEGFLARFIHTLFSALQPTLKQRLHSFKTTAFGSANALYVAIHLRDIDGTKVRWTRDIQGGAGSDVRMTAAIKETLRYQHTMPPAYVLREMVAWGFLSHPRHCFLGHDRARMALADALTNHTSIRAQVLPPVTPRDAAIVLDMAMMMDAVLFLGNDASTVSMNVDRARKWRQANFETQHKHHRTPYKGSNLIWPRMKSHVDYSPAPLWQTDAVWKIHPYDLCGSNLTHPGTNMTVHCTSWPPRKSWGYHNGA